MTKKLVQLGAFAMLSMSAMAQQRLVLYEEFSGENCGPCAQNNPALWSLMSANTDKICLIKYQSPIPDPGPLYFQYVDGFNVRGAVYYKENSAPSGRMDGKVVGRTSNIVYTTQAHIDAAAAVASPFNITVSHAWNATGDSVTATVKVDCVTDYAPANGKLKLRIALLEHLVFDVAPGTNGEKEFHNVVREMYPDAEGTAISNTWTAGQTETFTIKGAVPEFVNVVDEDTRMIAWLQNDNDKTVEQTALSTHIPVTIDVASVNLAIPKNLYCTGINVTVASTVTIKNPMPATTLTSADIYYRADNGSWQKQAWTGSLAPNATATVNLPALSLVPGARVIFDSVNSANGQVDINRSNNKNLVEVWVHDTTPNALPLSNDFEAWDFRGKWFTYDIDGDLNNWYIVSAGRETDRIGHGNSRYTAYFDNYTPGANESNLLILPTPDMPAGNKALYFWYAYAQLSLSGGLSNDKLEAVYSTDCGANWTSLWAAAGADLATAPKTIDVSFVPRQNQWKYQGVDVTSVPTGAMIALKATSATNGNNLFVDDIKLIAGTTEIEQVLEAGTAHVFPNPATDQVTVSFSLNKRTDVQILVLDAAGRIVNTISKAALDAGLQQVTVPTADLSTGIYHIKIQTGGASITERVSILK